MEIDQNATYAIPGSVLAGLLDYLGTRPFREVAGGMTHLAAVVQAGPLPPQEPPAQQPEGKQ